MSFIPVLQYIAGVGVFGFCYWITNGIMEHMINSGVSQTGTTMDLLHAFWTSIIIIYIIFGGWWVIRKYNEQEYRGGF